MYYLSGYCYLQQFCHSTIKHALNFVEIIYKIIANYLPYEYYEIDQLKDNKTFVRVVDWYANYVTTYCGFVTTRYKDGCGRLGVALYTNNALNTVEFPTEITYTRLYRHDDILIPSENCLYLCHGNYGRGRYRYCPRQRNQRFSDSLYQMWWVPFGIDIV